MEPAIEVRCPQCGAQPYQMCMNFGKKPRNSIHKDRRKLAAKPSQRGHSVRADR